MGFAAGLGETIIQYPHALVYFKRISCPAAAGYGHDFPGDLTVGETPDPIPNSEAKPNRPMIVFGRK